MEQCKDWGTFGTWGVVESDVIVAVDATVDEVSVSFVEPDGILHFEYGKGPWGGKVSKDLPRI